MKQFTKWIKSEVVLCVACVLAVISAFFVFPDRKYLSYIDFRTLSILFCLMCVMAGLKKQGVFNRIAGFLLSRVKNTLQIVMILVFLCFGFSMVITNDVALITFVPFSFITLSMLGEEKKEKLIVPIVVLQTIAANLGSMLTPIGNPQNLYLYGKAQMSPLDFLLLVLPYVLFAFVLIGIGCFLFVGKRQKAKMQQNVEILSGNKMHIRIYLGLFLVCLLTVARVLPYPAALILTGAVMLFLDREVLKSVDYSLLLTFVGFFVFIGNMGRIPSFASFLQKVIVGNEVSVSVLLSQVISNVPAALLLSGFTQNYKALIIGVNIGGLGTLIASMASLISYKLICSEEPQKKGQYFRLFTVCNLVFLGLLLGFHYIVMI